MTHNPHPSYTLGENNYSKGSLLLRKKCYITQDQGQRRMRVKD